MRTFSGGDVSKPRWAAVIGAVAAMLMVTAAPAGAVTESCDKVDGAHSMTYGQEATITITNYLSNSVHIYWINYQGNRVVYRNLEPGESYRQKTYFTHIWLATVEDGSCASLFLVDRQIDRFAIRAEAPPQRSRSAKSDVGLQALAPGWRESE